MHPTTNDSNPRRTTLTNPLSAQEACDGCEDLQHDVQLVGWKHLCRFCREMEASERAPVATLPAAALATPASNDVHPGLCPDPMACEACQSRVWPSGSAPVTLPAPVVTSRRRRPATPRLTPAAQAVRAALGGSLPRPGDLDAEQLGARLGLSAMSVRRAVRDLAEVSL